MSRFLITTALQETWRDDVPVLFLGDWCCTYDQRDKWQELDYLIAKTFRESSEHQKKDVALIEEMSSRLLIDLSVMLNLHHKKNYSLRYWDIVLGEWLRRSIFTVFNRYISIKEVLLKYEISGTSILDSSDYSLAVQDSGSFTFAANDDLWNHVLYSRILETLVDDKFEFTVGVKPVILNFAGEIIVEAAQKSLKRKMFNALERNLRPFSRTRDSFISHTYLPFWKEVQLQLAFRQVPQIWESPVLPHVDANLNLRKSISLGGSGQSEFETFVRKLLPQILPICYLENYDTICQIVSDLPWPSKPKFIFTSNRFFSDEIFKAWVGEKTEHGIPYFVGQHGANYGTFFSSDYWTEITTADRFLTWGWANDSAKDLPAFVFNIASKPRKSNPNGGLLLIELPKPDRVGLAGVNTVYSNFDLYQEQQFRFVNALPLEIQQKLTVRLHGHWKRMRWCDDLRWKDQMPTIRVETGVAPIQNLIENSRLVVHSYDSTGILEGLASNIPTLCFWYGGLDYLHPKAKPYYEMLRNVGIIANSPEEAAKHVSLYWENIEAWWESNEVQSARQNFCELYANTVKHPVVTLKHILSLNLDT